MADKNIVTIGGDEQIAVVAVPVDDNFALVRMKEAEASIEQSRSERTCHVTSAIVMVVFFAAVTTCIAL